MPDGRQRRREVARRTRRPTAAAPCAACRERREHDCRAARRSGRPRPPPTGTGRARDPPARSRRPPSSPTPRGRCRRTRPARRTPACCPHRRRRAGDERGDRSHARRRPRHVRPPECEQQRRPRCPGSRTTRRLGNVAIQPATAPPTTSATTEPRSRTASAAQDQQVAASSSPRTLAPRNMLFDRARPVAKSSAAAATGPLPGPTRRSARARADAARTPSSQPSVHRTARTPSSARWLDRSRSTQRPGRPGTSPTARGAPRRSTRFMRPSSLRRAQHLERPEPVDQAGHPRRPPRHGNPAPHPTLRRRAARVRRRAARGAAGRSSNVQAAPGHRSPAMNASCSGPCHDRRAHAPTAHARSPRPPSVQKPTPRVTRRRGRCPGRGASRPIAEPPSARSLRPPRPDRERDQPPPHPPRRHAGKEARGERGVRRRREQRRRRGRPEERQHVDREQGEAGGEPERAHDGHPARTSAPLAPDRARTQSTWRTIRVDPPRAAR
jgi:hypothetical protein